MSATATDNKNYYEGMFLIHSGRFASDSEGVTNELMEILEKCEAEVAAHRPWTEGKLAYEIENQRKGLHYLVMFRMPPRNNTQLNRLCQLNDNILRHLIINHPQSLFDANVTAISQAPSTDEDEAGDEEE
ncbi:MAG: 30S ribosomal protein S6 [Planctomycetaceae bacterium]|nr:30S ribosomal protein S6 [Planctomycetaceae bacterium]